MKLRAARAAPSRAWFDIALQMRAFSVADHALVVEHRQPAPPPSQATLRGCRKTLASPSPCRAASSASVHGLACQTRPRPRTLIAVACHKCSFRCHSKKRARLPMRCRMQSCASRSAVTPGAAARRPGIRPRGDDGHRRRAGPRRQADHVVLQRLAPARMPTSAALGHDVGEAVVDRSPPASRPGSAGRIRPGAARPATRRRHRRRRRAARRASSDADFRSARPPAGSARSAGPSVPSSWAPASVIPTPSGSCG